ncbi:MAG: amidohydrolase [SAR202 cluster bacterium]|nr:amidohydrolase [SAR202 cluster bacterium]
MYQGYKIIDADAHFFEPIDIWDRYIDPEFYNRRPIVTEYDGRARMRYKEDGVLFTRSKIISGSKRYKTMEQKYGHAWRSWWSLESRLIDMDTFGWDIQVCLATNGFLGSLLSRKDLQYGASLVRGFNNWAHDFCSGAPDRVKFVAALPGGDPGESAKEARRAVDQLGAVSVVIETAAPGRMWHQPDYDPLWQAAIDLDFPISIHGNQSMSGEPASFARYDSMGGPFIALHHAINFSVEDMIAMGHFMLSGILDRYPTLRLSFLEGNAGWVPFWLNRLEKCVEGRQAVTFDAEPLKASPFEYFHRQCFIAADADEPTLKSTVEHIGDEAVVFNTDYPHADAPNPSEPVPQMIAQPLPDSSKRKIFWDNSIRLYGPRLLNGKK